jgi:hypothetical protein
VALQADVAVLDYECLVVTMLASQNPTRIGRESKLFVMPLERRKRFTSEPLAGIFANLNLVPSDFWILRLHNLSAKRLGKKLTPKTMPDRGMRLLTASRIKSNIGGIQGSGSFALT